MADEDNNQTSALLSFMMQNLRLPGASSTSAQNQPSGRSKSSINVESQAALQQNIGQRAATYGTSSLFLTDYERHAWLGRGQLQVQGTGQSSDKDNFRASSDDSTETSASVSYRSEPSETPGSYRRKASCTDSGFMPWSQDVDDVEESDPHFLSEVQQSAVQETSSDQGLHTPTQALGIREARHASYNSAHFQEREDMIPSRGVRPAALPTAPQNQSFFSPSPSPSDYSLTRALLGFNELFASSQTASQLRPFVSSEGKPHSEDTSPLGIYFRERSQSADRMADPGVPTRFLKVSNVDRKMSIWVARDTFKSFGDLRGTYTSFLMSDGVIFLEFFDIRHAMIASKRLYSSPAFENSSIKIHFCPFSYIRRALPECPINGNEGVLAVSLQAPILTDNDLLRFLSTFGEIQSFQKEFNGWPPMILVEYYDTRHAASALSALREMHNNQQSIPPIGYRMTRTHSTPGDIMYPPSGSAGRSVDASRSNDQAGSPRSGNTVQQPTEQTLKTLSSSAGDRCGLTHPAGDVVDSNAREEHWRFAAQSQKLPATELPATERPRSPLSLMRTTSMISNTGHVQRDVVIPLAPSDKRTTLMIRNIPNKYTQPMLLECINETHFGMFDFLYLRMDFKNKCNVGYAFINFINTEVIASFVQQHVGKKWGRFNSDKICSLSYAAIQGRRALVDKFRNSSVMDEEASYRPKIFYTTGPSLGLEEPFPGPTLSKECARGHGPAHGPARRRVSSAPPHNEP
ncbi:MAG: RNA recognition motif 2-domain-containing protein [Linnemannia elongata]|nr:MAG: RNA recognition motif 2-domain-containing protein [Linnemannia elongata]